MKIFGLKYVFLFPSLPKIVGRFGGPLVGFLKALIAGRWLRER
jgi:hypothetical protein